MFDNRGKFYPMETDPLYKRIFKTKTDYIKEGCVHASNVYKDIINELDCGFSKVRDQFKDSIEQKQRLIDDLIYIISELRRKKDPSEEELKTIILCEQCIDLFREEITLFSSDEMSNLSLDKRYADWRYVYGNLEND